MCSNKSNSCPLKKLGHDWTGFQSQHLISYVGLIVSSKIFLVKNSENITYKMQKKNLNEIFNLKSSDLLQIRRFNKSWPILTVSVPYNLRFYQVHKN